MNIGIFVTARLGSTRLKRKHLLAIEGQSAIEILLNRVRFEFMSELALGTAKIVIVTADESENRDFEKFVDNYTSVFFGSIHNIPLRHLQAATCGCVDGIVAVDGDDILCSQQAMRQVHTALEQGKRYVKTSGLPIGLNAFGYKTEFLSESIHSYEKAVLETGWGRIFPSEVCFEIHSPPIEDVGEEFLRKLRYTLDYPLDYDLFCRLVRKIGSGITSATDREIVAVTIEESLYLINQSVLDVYWDNVETNLALEKREM